MEDITDANCKNTKFWGDFGILNVGEYHDLLADKFENFCNKCIEIF